MMLKTNKFLMLACLGLVCTCTGGAEPFLPALGEPCNRDTVLVNRMYHDFGGGYVATEFADMNGDGHLDIVLIELEEILVFIGHGDGSFDLGFSAQIPAMGYSVLSQGDRSNRFPYLVTKDLDLDGDIDVIVGDKNDALVMWNDGNAQLTSQLLPPVPWSYHEIIAEDLDQDGIPEVLISTLGDEVFVYRLTQDHQYEPYFDSPLTGARVRATDLDLDKDTDLVLTFTASSTWTVMLNDGEGSYTSNEISGMYGAYSSPLELEDVNHDSIPDLIYARVVPRLNDPYSIFVVKFGTLDGTFSGGTSVYTTRGHPSSFVIADVDGDSHKDIAFVSYAEWDLDVLLNNGSGVFDTLLPRYPGARPIDLAFGDMNEDGHLDAMVAKNSNGDFTYFLNTCIPLNYCPDLNDDGALDFYDVSQYVRAYIAGDPVADMTGNGSLDFYDVSLFLELFMAGCP